MRAGLTLALLLCGAAHNAVAADIQLPANVAGESLAIVAGGAQRWQEGGYEVWLLTDGVELRQPHASAAASQGVLWIERADPLSGAPHKVIAYLEGEVVLDGRPQTATPGEWRPVNRADRASAPPAASSSSWLGRFYASAEIQFQTPPATGEPALKPPLYGRAKQAREPQPIQQVQFQQDVSPAPVGVGVSPLPAAPLVNDPGQPPAPGFRRVFVRPRSAVPLQARWFPSANGNERIAVLDNGVNIVVQGLDQLGTLDISADRIVVWTGNLGPEALGEGSTQQSRTPLEFYLEGNIVFRQGDRVVYAERMYYNVNGETGLVLNAELLTPVPEYQGLLRFKADVLRQLDRQHFEAHTAAVTSSRLGVPSYWLQAGTVQLEDRQGLAANSVTGDLQIDPVTGEPGVNHDFLATANNNFVYVGGVPVFYWPTLATDLTKSSFYIDRIRVKNDSIFGVQILADWDLYQVLGIRQPLEGTKWQLSTDYLSDRGFALGTNFKYTRDDLFGIPGPYSGFVDAWGLYEQGLDNLGRDRAALVPEADFRGRVVGQHRHRFGDGWQLTAELGLVSDRNFLEQYYEQEWDEFKDATTGVELKRLLENQSFNLSGDLRLNDFFTQTEGARFDHFILGQSIFDRLTWHAHSHAGYAKIGSATRPLDAVDAAKFNPLAWEPLDPVAIPGDREGLRAATRHELDLPVELGPVKVVPYALGEIAYWGEDLLGAETTRTYGQLGVRASLPMWKADNAVQSLLFNVNGLAHKVSFDADVYWAEASENFERFPLYDPLDDDSIEHFRRRFVDNTFGGALNMDDLVPAPFDERRFALRSGLQGSVASPSTELAEDLKVARFGVRQRWQTKRGLPGQERIIDWIVFDAETSFYADSARDNFGEQFGLTNYFFEWHVGDRLTLLSDGIFDFFHDGQRVVNVGALMSRPERMNVYFGFRSIEGPLSSNILAASVAYRMSEKWIVSASGAYDLGSVGNIGQDVKLVRVGESFLVSVGLNIDSGRDNVGVNFTIEPRFLSSSRLGRVGGVQIPPAGAFGLE